MGKFGVIDQFDTPIRGKNLGDYVQTIAALQFLPEEPVFVDRENMDGYHGEKLKLIMSSWLMKHPEHWPPSEDIEPLFVSSHFNERILPRLISKEGKEYLKKFEPIGCRDTETADVLKKNGVDAYFSGCLTLTLGKTYQNNGQGEEILLIDTMYSYRTGRELIFDIFHAPGVLYWRVKKGGMKELKSMYKDTKKKKSYFKKLFSSDFLKKAITISQIVPLTKEQDHLQITRDYLTRLSKAKLVVTSRIHCALPCLAMNTPVIFIDSELDQHRVSGLKELFNTIKIENGVITSNFAFDGKISLHTKIVNRPDYLELNRHLEERCNEFVNKK